MSKAIRVLILVILLAALMAAGYFMDRWRFEYQMHSYQQRHGVSE